MAIPLSLVALPPTLGAPIARRTTKFHPSISGDTFLTFSSDETTLYGWRKMAETLRGEVQEMLIGNDSLDNQNYIAQLSLIDRIQRLGIAYHFEEEIEKVLAKVFALHGDEIHNHIDDINSDNLNFVALKFRLLRAEGFNIPCDVFRKFMDNKGNFMKSLKEDIDGVLSLYEAANLRLRGEVILDDALTFTTTSLKAMLPNLSPIYKKKVLHALNRPLHKGLSRLDSVYQFSIDEELNNDTLLKFAKLDFNILQKMHQKELSILSKWWEDLDVSSKFPFARDRIVECYFWILGVYFEPKYAFSRRFLTQVISMASIVDDMYDNYGTTEELELFTQAIDRWDKEVVVDLPVYMKPCYRALLDVYNNMEKEMTEEGKPVYGVRYAKEAMKGLVQAYYEERKWLDREEFPTIEEYMKTALPSCGYPMLAVASLVGMEDVANEEAFKWMITVPKITQASTLICRLTDDLVGYELERERGSSPSFVEIFAREHRVSENDACNMIKLEIENAWKDINEGFMKPTPIARAILMRPLNFGRVIEVLYKESDGYTHVNAIVEQYIISLLKTAIEV